MKTKKYIAIFGILAGITILSSSVVNASHSWGKYHWDLSTGDTTANPLKLGDNLTTAAWKDSLSIASLDWNGSVLKNQVITGTSANCDPTLGQVEVCNDLYGENGWLGIAQIWVYRGKAGHIAQAVVKANDTYFNTPAYNTSAWRNFVVCQEVGHTFGLGHQDEDFNNLNLGTCMDYTNDPARNDGNGNNLHPNQHDYGMLTEIYAHLNSTEDGGGPRGGNGKGNGKKPADVGANIDLDNPSEWGQAIKQDAQGMNSLFEKDLANGNKVFTFVIWAN
ncbi:MAG: hypothetical protein CO183_01375 [Candidatus Zambryskibacteria bacterium CG_4_9_14_3_um_filter_42_9]|uniref:Peptidase M10 metallopeptidase domain-containing protein n=1 Tax=Candidatus Zambryskibacteria bacterium CG22_combo_CG10-13_8_21_14_all_42_17 TaxID=1975118 RepID=A0A2H0BEZ3_9BACT|nr:MAG: hypothetical protein COX06_02555 [Candidatus Zambryskibacteria bacterium CG22_combo_CG10-13_8_21_14_all_42_17]PJA36843.1 MAG: hypothetical protein CO183_01375 [Candidatus Zambryskibacteria bacterium CG_4_9_14_3_um_filter_42_9]